MASILSLVVGITLILGQATCQVQFGITVVRVTEGSRASLACECADGNSTSVRWLRNPRVHGVAEQQISCHGNHCFVLDYKHGQNWTDGNYKILNNGTLRVRAVVMQDSGLYWCLVKTPWTSSSLCNHTSSLCASQQLGKASTHCRTPPPLFISVLPRQQEYKVSVHTGSRFRSGTDAKVFINLCGEITCVESELNTSKPNPFEKGQKDDFTINGPYLGHLTKLKIWHDGAGVLSDWFLEKVTVKEPLSGMSYTFTCNCWIEGISGRILSPQVKNRNKVSRQIRKHQKEDEETNLSVARDNEPLHKHPLPSWELQNRLISNSSALWIFCDYEGSNKVVSVLCPMFVPCLDTAEREKPQMPTPEDDSCPERSQRCLLLSRHEKRNELQKYWCIFGPAENGTWGRLIPPTVWKGNGSLNESQDNSTLRLTQIITTTTSEKDVFQNISNVSIPPPLHPQRWKEIIPLVVFPIVGVLLIGIFIYLLRGIYKESTDGDVNILRNHDEMSQEVMITGAEQFCLTTPSDRQSEQKEDMHTEGQPCAPNADVEPETMYDEVHVNITSPSSRQNAYCGASENTLFPEDPMCVYSIATLPGAASKAPGTVPAEGSNDETQYAVRN
uniref:uncharacterized protein n=1 Tax=Myxine glutinosa TaxID=7769 RepID=UPI003590090D